MENCGTSIVNAFDSLFTNNKIQMLKILISHLPSENQGALAVYIKFMELQHTLTFLQHHPGVQLFGNTSELSFDFFSGDNTGTVTLLEELLPFSGPEEQNKIRGMIQMMQNMKQMREMMEMIQMMQEMFPEGMGSGDGEGSPMDMFSAMSSMMGGMNGDENGSPMDMFSAMSGMMGGMNEDGNSSPMDMFSAMNMMNEMNNGQNDN